MWIRNKKTGRVCDAIVRERKNSDGSYSTIVCTIKKHGLGTILAEYHSLAKLYEDWEDYTPAEPLIKDEKIRKAVKAWAEANDYPKTMELYYNALKFVLRSNISTIEFEKEIEPLSHGDEYTITELCGDE